MALNSLLCADVPLRTYTLTYVAHVLFFIVESGIALFLCTCACYVRVRGLDIILTPQATSVPNFVSVVPSITALACGEKLHTQSITHSLTLSPSLFDSPGTKAYASKQTALNPTFGIIL